MAKTKAATWIQAASTSEKAQRAEPAAQGQDEKPKRLARTYYVNEDVSAQLRNAAIYLAGHPAYLTLSEIVEEAFALELRALEKRWNEGNPFPLAKGRLKTGRPTKKA
jgi:hypothetical protein